MFNDSIFEDKKQELVKINWTFSYTLLEVYINSYIKISTQVQFSSVQSLSRVQLFATPWIAARQASLSITNSQSSLKLTSIKLVMPSSHLILCHPLLLLPPISPSIRVFFQWVSSSHELAKVLDALASLLPKNTQDWSPLEWTGNLGNILHIKR